MYELQHTGYPVAGRSIAADEWKKYSKHASLWAAIRKMDKNHEHLSLGSWDDHYRIVDPNGNVLNHHDIDQERYAHWK
jgi:hypothetical protein